MARCFVAEGGGDCDAEMESAAWLLGVPFSTSNRRDDLRQFLVVKEGVVDHCTLREGTSCWCMRWHADKTLSHHLVSLASRARD